SCYADASFQTDKDDTKSQTGYVFVLNGEAMDWKSDKQSTTVGEDSPLSLCEGEDSPLSLILSFLVLAEGCDPLALVESLTPVECNTRLLETRFEVESIFVFSVDGKSCLCVKENPK
ncbi:hypothetical protein Tco_0240382, partial [Tanacetum coccineum]